MAWIRDRVDPDAPDTAHIVLGIDHSERAGAGERAVSELLGFSMESEEGVFYLLPQDLCYEVTRSGGLVTVELLTMPNVPRGETPSVDAPDDWVKVLSAEIPFPGDGVLPGPPVVLIDHDGVVGPDELVAAIRESGVHIVGPKPDA